MEAMVETRRYDEAEELYTDVVDYYLREVVFIHLQDSWEILREIQ